MDFLLDDDQEMVKCLAERFVADRYAPGSRAGYRANARGYEPANWALLAEIGMLAVPFAEDDGGLGGGLVEIATMMEALGRGLVAEPILSEAIIAGALLAEAGSDAQKAAWVDRIMSGTAHVGLAHAEHGSRYDLRRITTRFEDGRLTGHKTAVDGGQDALIVTAMGVDGPGLYLAEGDAPGMSWRRYRLVDGSVAGEVGFAGTPATSMQGGLAALERIADRARVAAAAEMVGLIGMIFDATLDYVRQRRQFGTLIGSFQAIQHRLADQYAALEQCRSQVFRTMTGDPAAIAGAKAYIATAAVRLGEECIQFHGGMGVTDELEVGHAHKRVLRLACLFGDAAHEQRRYHRMMQG